MRNKFSSHLNLFQGAKTRGRDLEYNVPSLFPMLCLKSRPFAGDDLWGVIHSAHRPRTTLIIGHNSVIVRRSIAISLVEQAREQILSCGSEACGNGESAGKVDQLFIFV